ncbi:hypothetical protein OkiPb01551_34980 [Bordetella pertussis]|nr:hypothetical protein BPJ_10940 [Bordetella pertussis]BDC26442.1 hypothetical protein NB2BOR_A07330 [Bordetella parapertussis]BDT09615.1 hypothetical protein BP3J_33190 [Bordetella pertussis]
MLDRIADVAAFQQAFQRFGRFHAALHGGAALAIDQVLAVQDLQVGLPAKLVQGLGQVLGRDIDVDGRGLYASAQAGKRAQQGRDQAAGARR